MRATRNAALAGLFAVAVVTFWYGQTRTVSRVSATAPIETPNVPDSKKSTPAADELLPPSDVPPVSVSEAAVGETISPPNVAPPGDRAEMVDGAREVPQASQSDAPRAASASPKGESDAPSRDGDEFPSSEATGTDVASYKEQARVRIGD